MKRRKHVGFTLQPSEIIVSMAMAVVVAVVASPTAFAACGVTCNYNKSTDCYDCGSSPTTKKHCIIGDPCPGGDFGECFVFGSCVAGGNDVVITFDAEAIALVADQHPRVASLLSKLNSLDGVRWNTMTYKTADKSTLARGDEVEYLFTVRTEDGHPSVLEVKAEQPWRDQPPMGMLLFDLRKTDGSAFTAVKARD